MTRDAEDEGRKEGQDAPMSSDDELSVGPLGPGDERPRLAAPLRRVWRWSGLVAFVTLAAIVIAAVAPHIPRAAPARAALPYTTLHVSYDVARCLSGFSWSHDSRQIAALTSYDCSSPDFGNRSSVNNLYLFDAATGKLTTTVAIEPALVSALRQAGFTSDVLSQYGISYYDSDWSPDNQQLATELAVFGSNAAINGIALVTLTGPQRGHVAIMLGDPIKNGQAFQAPSAFGPQPALRWDLTTGAATTIYLQPALAYQWLPGDVLVADAPLPVSASAPAANGSMGSAAGGQTVSLWRTGYISLVNATDCNPSPSTAPLPSPYVLLSLNTMAWSPDGRFLLDVYTLARLTTSFPHAKAVSVAQLSVCDQGPALNQIPAVTPHDKGLDAALRRLDPAGKNTLTLSWSPDGRRLAALTTSYNYNGGEVTIYDCASGKQIRSLTSGQFNSVDVYSEPNPTNGFDQAPLWSPDSSRLLLLIDGIEPQAIVLGARALGG
jgi:WD40 repeat protein